MIATEIMIQTALSLTLSMVLASQAGNPLSARNFVRKIVPMRIIKILPVPRAVAVSASTKFVRENFPRKTARIVARKAPTAPASVGVKKPAKIPPSTKMIKVGSAHTFNCFPLFLTREMLLYFPGQVRCQLYTSYYHQNIQGGR